MRKTESKKERQRRRKALERSYITRVIRLPLTRTSRPLCPNELSLTTFYIDIKKIRQTKFFESFILLQEEEKLMSVIFIYMIKMQNILTFYYEYQHIFILDFVLLLIDH